MSIEAERAAQKCPAYNDGLRSAARLAAVDPAGRSYSVSWDGRTIFVRAPDGVLPPNSTVVCIAQRWDADTVQLRFAGARSEWVKI
jgi:hypothetical protein